MTIPRQQENPVKDRFAVQLAHAGLMLTLCQSALASSELFELSLEELQNVRISVASGFEESVLDAASSVSLIQREDWMARGARRNVDALEASPGVNLAPAWAGAETISIRGYTTDLSVRGIATLVDGVPVNMFT